ncbi:hypothetical protein quinque_010594 [Culex quinquefasciatus]
MFRQKPLQLHICPGPPLCGGVEGRDRTCEIHLYGRFPHQQVLRGALNYRQREPVGPAPQQPAVIVLVLLIHHSGARYFRR